MKYEEDPAGAAILTPKQQRGHSTVAVELFKLTDIPSVMDRLGWTQAARFQRKWFSGAAWEMPLSVKTGAAVLPSTASERLLEDIPFDWLTSASARVAPQIESYVAALRSVNQYSDIIGLRRNHPLDQLSPGLLVFLKRLEALGAMTPDKDGFVDFDWDLSGYPASQLDSWTQFNFFRVGASMWEQAFDELDDVYGALGAFSVKVAATRFRVLSDHLGFATLSVSEIGLYIRDTFDFRNDSGDQLLGYWNKRGVLKPSLWAYLKNPDYIDRDGLRWFRVSNGCYNEYRDRYGTGGDFLIYSTVKRLPVRIVLHLSKLDFQEYVGRRPGS